MVTSKSLRMVALGAAGWVAVSVGMLGACSRHASSSGDAGDAAPGKLGTTPNLIVNGDAESGAGSSSGDVVVSAIPGWSTTGNANVLMYGAHGGYPLATDPGPADRGANFFAGGPNDTPSIFTQHIDLGAYAAFIARGDVSFALSAYLGGYSDQDDNAVLKLSFLGKMSGTTPNVLGVVTLGPVLSADRNGDTELLARATTGAVPAGASSVDAELTMTRTAGSNNDGYADDLIFTLTDEPPPGDAGSAPDAADVPGAAIASADIGPSGATLSLGTVTLVVPPGALTATTTIVIAAHAAPADTASMRFVSPLFELTPDGLQLAMPAVLSIDLSNAALPAGTTATIANVTASGTVTPVPSQATATGVSAQIAHFSFWDAVVSLMNPVPCTSGGLGCTAPAICCPADSTSATDFCIDVKANDAKHCGSCSTNCAASVLGGPNCCGGLCVNSKTDPKHCGMTCDDCLAKGQGCRDGQCAPCDGIQTKVVDMPCPTAAICHGGLGTNKACEMCKGFQTQKCDGTPLQDPVMACCAQCPGDAPENDQACDPPPQDDPRSCGLGKPNGCP